MRKTSGIVVILCVGLVVAMVGVLSFRSSSSSSATANPRLSTGVPPSVERAMAVSVESRYGGTPTVVVADTTTMTNWKSIEPSETSGMSVDSANAATNVYGFVITGSFQVQNPPPPQAGVANPPGTTPYTQGRVVVDANGNILAMSLWNTGLSATAQTSAFGAVFQDV